MAGQYETYLARLRQIKQSRPEMNAYNRTMQMQSKPFNLMNEATARMTQQGGASTGAQIAALSEGRRQWNQEQQSAYNQALTASGDKSLDLKIAEVEAANEAEKQQQALAKGQRTAGAIQTGLTVAGTVIGAVVGAPTVGAAIGEAAGGFVGVDKDGNLSLSPENWDTQKITQGAGAVFSSLSSMANENKMKEMMMVTANNTQALQEYIENNPDMAPQVRMQMEMAVKNGDKDALNALYNNIIAANVQRRDMMKENVASAGGDQGMLASAGQYPSNDYDYAGWEKDTGKKYTENKGHLPDTYKLPNHITFSTDSKYTSGDKMGGEWKEVNGKWQFTPSAYNLSQYTPEQYREYFSKNEPDAVLNLPPTETQAVAPDTDLLTLRNTFRNAGYSSTFVNDNEKLLAEAVKLGYITMKNGKMEWTAAGKASKYYKGE